MNDPDINSLMQAAAERQLAVAALQKKYGESESIPTEQLVLDAIITLFVKLGQDADHKPIPGATV